MANMRCTVKIFLDEVTCPGTLHLPDRNPVYLSIFLFGRLQKSIQVYPSFPMGFATKIKFQRLFTNAKTPEQVLEILEDEAVLIEMRQHAKGLKGGLVLAEFKEATRPFLFPSPSLVPKRDLLKRSVLLTRSENFPKGKLDPQFTFRTKTYIEEGPFIHLTPNKMSVSREIPASDLHISPENKAVTRKNKGSAKKEHSPISIPTESENKDGVVEHGHKHCICDCPILDNEPGIIDHFLENWKEMKKAKSKRKPFCAAGKAPKQLISKREFGDFKNGRNFSRNGICKYCVIPLSNCVLCNAYKSVYGAKNFLKHRFSKVKPKLKHARNSMENFDATLAAREEKSVKPTYDFIGFDDEEKVVKPTMVDILTSDGNLKPTKLDGAKSVPISRVFSKPVYRSYNEEEMREIESGDIHQRIKNLMKKNKSVLQYDLSSSESITDDECYSADDSLGLDSLLDGAQEIPQSVKKKLPTKSFVEPIAPMKKLSSVSGINNGLSHRDKLDARLKAIYADLYRETLNNP